MEFILKHFTLKYYLRYVRRQSKHVQHIHALVFAGTITGLIAVFILYTDYGCWHETYVADDLLVGEEAKMESPSESMADFFREAKERFGSIGKASGNLLEGKVEYKKEP